MLTNVNHLAVLCEIGASGKVTRRRLEQNLPRLSERQIGHALAALQDRELIVGEWSRPDRGLIYRLAKSGRAYAAEWREKLALFV